MMGLGVWELSIILIIVIVVFGASRLPKIGEGLGRGITNFRKEVKTDKKKDEAVTETIDDQETASSSFKDS